MAKRQDGPAPVLPRLSLACHADGEGRACRVRTADREGRAPSRPHRSCRFPECPAQNCCVTIGYREFRRLGERPCLRNSPQRKQCPHRASGRDESRPNSGNEDVAPPVLRVSAAPHENPLAGSRVQRCGRDESRPSRSLRLRVRIHWLVRVSSDADATSRVPPVLRGSA